MFLAIQIVQVIDVAFVEGVAEIPEIIADPEAEPPVVGIPGTPAIIEVPEVSHLEAGKIFIEPNEKDVVENVVKGVSVEYYEIDAAPGSASLNSVAVKSGPRTRAPDREVVEIEANGRVVGSAIRDKP